jgi:hypothetical protein
MNNETKSFQVRYFARGIAADSGKPSDMGTALAVVRYMKRRGFTAWVVDAATRAFVPVAGAKRNPEAV